MARKEFALILFVGFLSLTSAVHYKGLNHYNDVNKVCPQKRGYFAYPGDCSKFYDCWDGTVMVRSCGQGENFDSVRRICDLIGKAKCADDATTSASTTVNSLDPEKVCPEKRGQFAYPPDCTKFYDCWDEVVMVRPCPEGQGFDVNLRICDLLERIVCFGSTRSGVVTKPTSPDPPRPSVNPDEVCLEKRGQFPVKEDCSKFYDCWDGTVLVRSCPAGQGFDANLRICDLNERITCYGSTKNPARTTTPFVPTQSFDPEKVCLSKRGQFPVKEDCTKFYDCWDGIVVLRSCPPGFGFHAKKLYCDHLSTVQCAKRVPTLFKALHLH